MADVSVSNTNTLSTDFNVDPYYDDFDETKNFHRFLFRPGRAVQGRELTQLQTLLQNQIDRFGEHILKEGAVVKGCEILYDQQVGFVRIRDSANTGSTVNAAALVGTSITGQTSGITAYVVGSEDGSEADGLDTKTLFVKYTSSSSNNIQKIFVGDASSAGEQLVANSGLSANVVSQANATGYSARMTVREGIIFAKDHFIRVPEQSVIVGKRSRFPTVRVGFDIAENVVTSLQDSSLLDPASGAKNYSAVGADRLKLDPILTTRSTTSSFGANSNFVELLQIKNGAMELKRDASTYNKLRDYVARRAFDNEGDYVTEGMGVRVHEHLKTGNNNGILSSSSRGNNNLLMLGVESGKAYVRGYDHKTSGTTYVETPKGIDIKTYNDATVSTNYGNYVQVYGVAGSWDFNKHSVISLRNSAANTYVHTGGIGGNNKTGVAVGSEIGTARARALEYVSGTPGSNNALYNLYLYDIQMSSANFANVRSVFLDNWTSGSAANSIADVVLSNGVASIQEPGFVRGVYPIGSRGVKQLTDASGTLDLDHRYLKRESVNISNTGVFTITTSAASGTGQINHGTGTLTASQIRDNYHLFFNTTANTSTAHHTGTVTVTGANVAGSGTDFASEYNVGEYIHFGNGTQGERILTIQNDTNLIISNTKNWSTGGSQNHHKVIFAGQAVDLTGTGAAGSNTATGRLVGSSSSTSVRFDLKEGFNTTGSVSATVISKQKRVDGAQIDKTIRKNRYVQLNLSSANGGILGPWNLGVSDIHKITQVRRKGSAFSALTDGVDVTENFVLDNGQRDNLYNHGKLKRNPFKPLTLTTSDYLLVKYDFFEHDTSSGIGYFSVDSYPINDSNPSNTSIKTEEIPLFISPTDGKVLDLRDCIDIRPRISDTANNVTSLTNITTNPPTNTTISTIASGLHYSPPNANFLFDYQNYLGRVDLLVIDSKGSFRTVRGVPSEAPQPPRSPADAMILATLHIPPYPSIPLSEANKLTPNKRRDLAVKMTPTSQRGYKMKDIGALDERISRLEYYVALNQLERETAGRFIADSSGIDRFKNGIIVDGFTGHGVGDPADDDYSISIDRTKNEMRPPVKVDHVEMNYHSANSTNVLNKPRDSKLTLYINSTLSNTNLTGNTFTAGETITGAGGATGTLVYQVDNKLYIETITSGSFTAGETVTGGTSGSISKIQTVANPPVGKLVTLKYEHDQTFKNPYSTHTRNLAGLFYNFRGTMTLDPDNDTWESVIQLPDVNQNFDNNNDNYFEEKVITTEWGDWEVDDSSRNEYYTDPTVSKEVIINGDGREFLHDVERSIAVTDYRFQRSGVQIKRLPDTIKTTRNTNVVGVSVSKYMRSRIVKFNAIGMKPNTKLYAYFDNRYVSSYVTPTNSSYANTANEGGSLTSDANGNVYGLFRIPNDASLKFTTGTKVFRITDSPKNIPRLNETTTSADAFFTSSGTTKSVQDTIVTTRIPEIRNEAVSEYSGWKQDRHDVVNVLPGGEAYEASPQPGTANTAAVGSGSAQPPITTNPNAPVPIQYFIDAPELGESGLLWNGQFTGVINPTGLFDTQAALNAYSASLSVSGGACAEDPLAQTFTLADVGLSGASSSGAFLTKIDLYFQSKDANYPVSVEIREVDKTSNAITSKIVPFSQVTVNSADVNLSDDGSKPTPFTFSTPIYLVGSREYALVVRPAANNPNYNIWCSRLGEVDTVTGNRVSKQPAIGMLHASSNDRQYTAIQEEDLKFTVYLAKFTTNATGTAVLKKANVDFFTVDNVSNGVPGSTSQDYFTKFGEVIHGPQRITLTTSVSGTPPIANGAGQEFVVGGTSGAIGTVSRIGPDSNTGINASANDIVITKITTGTDFQIGETLTFKFSDTSVATGQTAVIHAKNYATGKLYYYDSTNYSNSYLYVSNTTGVYETPSGVTTNASAQFVANTTLTSRVNGYTANIVSRDVLNQDSFMLWSDYLDLNDTRILSSSKFASATNAFEVDSTDFTVGETTVNQSRRFILSKSSEKDQSLPPTGEAIINMFSRNDRVSPAIDIDRTYLVNIENMINADSSNEDSEWVNGPAANTTGGNAKSRYITKTVVLEDGQDAEDLLIYLDGYTPNDSQIKAYYKILNREDDDALEDRGWVPMTDATSNLVVSSTENRNDFTERKYTVPNWSDTYKSGANTTTGIIQYTNNSRVAFSRYKYLKVKLVLLSSTTVNPPRVRNFRAIALQK